MPKKVFKVKEFKGEPYEFDLEFETSEGDPRSETFHAVPSAPGKWIMEIGASMAREEIHRVNAINRFLDRVIVDADKARWETVLNDANNVVPIDTLTEITDWLIEEYTANPQVQP